MELPAALVEQHWEERGFTDAEWETFLKVHRCLHHKVSKKAPLMKQLQQSRSKVREAFKERSKMVLSGTGIRLVRRMQVHEQFDKCESIRQIVGSIGVPSQRAPEGGAAAEGSQPEHEASPDSSGPVQTPPPAAPAPQEAATAAAPQEAATAAAPPAAATAPGVAPGAASAGAAPKAGPAINGAWPDAGYPQYPETTEAICSPMTEPFTQQPCRTDETYRCHNCSTPFHEVVEPSRALQLALSVYIRYTSSTTNFVLDALD